jgi:hypothetical protein
MQVSIGAENYIAEEMKIFAESRYLFFVLIKNKGYINESI